MKCKNDISLSTALPAPTTRPVDFLATHAMLVTPLSTKCRGPKNSTARYPLEFVGAADLKTERSARFLKVLASPCR
jgi:hypothetical protein